MSVRLTRTPSGRIGPDVIMAALEILDEHGPDGFTMRAIATRANVSPMAIYNHFDGKNGVIDAIWSDGFEQFRTYLEVDSGNPRQDLLDAGLAYRTFAQNHRAHYIVMFMHQFVGFEPSLGSVHVSAQAFRVLVDHIERCRQIGLLRPYRSTNVAQMLWSACHGYVSLELLNNNFSDSPDETFKNLLDGLLRGLEHATSL
jgi:AcrR family transcriptional regulator